MSALAWARAGLCGLTIGVLSTACSRTQIEFGSAPEQGFGGSAGFGGSSGLGGSAGSLGGSAGSSGSAGSGAVSGSSGEGGSGGAPSQCMSEAVSDCDFCTCDGCLLEWEECVADGGCKQILDCADANGCNGVDCYLGPCNQVIDQNGGPFGNSANLAQNVGGCRDDAGCPCGGGTGGSGGGGGSGGSGGGTGGSGGSGPLACFQCVTQECPQVGECLLDDACRNGAICTFQQCMGGGGSGGSGGGLPNFQCVLQCFGGDFQAAITAFQGFQCFFTKCADDCQGGIPGLPGGGFPGGGFPGGGGSAGN